MEAMCRYGTWMWRLHEGMALFRLGIGVFDWVSGLGG